MGYPTAKSLLWVQKMEYRPEFEILVDGLDKINVIPATKTNTIDFDTNIPEINGQQMSDKLIVAIDMKISDGNEKIETNELNPLDSTSEIKFNRPDMYPNRISEKHCIKIPANSSIPNKLSDGTGVGTVVISITGVDVMLL